MFLKKRTPQNIVVGGAAGAFPPLIGWVGVSGSIDLSSIFLFLIIFFWTPPHAYALMLVLKEDYKNANIPMMPVVKGDKETVRQIIIYSIVFLAITIVPGVIGLFGMFYLISVSILGITLLLMSIKLFYNLTNKWAFRVYRYSTIQLALLFIALVIDQSVIG
jgi:protoheme IX farnesyltransferase